MKKRKDRTQLEKFVIIIVSIILGYQILYGILLFAVILGMPWPFGAMPWPFPWGCWPFCRWLG